MPDSPDKKPLVARHCAHSRLLAEAEATELLAQLAGWQRDKGAIQKNFVFANFYETMAFVNALAFIGNRENHHPDLQVSYGKCTVRFSTHSVHGLSENDFICAAKVDALLAD